PVRRASAEFVVGRPQGGQRRRYVPTQTRAVRFEWGAGVQLYRPVADVHRRRESAVALADANRAAVSAELAGRVWPRSPAATAYSCRGGRPRPHPTALAHSDLLPHPVHQVRLAVLRVGPEAQDQIVPGREGRGELGVPSCIEPRHTTQPPAGGQRALLTALLPGNEVLQRLSRRERRDHDLVGLEAGAFDPNGVRAGRQRLGELEVVV